MHNQLVKEELLSALSTLLNHLMKLSFFHIFASPEADVPYETLLIITNGTSLSAALHSTPGILRQSTIAQCHFPGCCSSSA